MSGARDRRRSGALGGLLVVLLGVLGAARPAVAQPVESKKPKCSDESQAGDKKGKTQYEIVVGPDGKRVYRIKTGFVICGKVPKPDVLYGILSTTINYEWESLKKDFLPLTTGSVEQAPF